MTAVLDGAWGSHQRASGRVGVCVFAHREEPFPGHCVLLTEGALEASQLHWCGDDDWLIRPGRAKAPCLCQLVCIDFKQRARQPVLRPRRPTPPPQPPGAWLLDPGVLSGGRSRPCCSGGCRWLRGQLLPQPLCQRRALIYWLPVSPPTHSHTLQHCLPVDNTISPCMVKPFNTISAAERTHSIFHQDRSAFKIRYNI